MHLLKDQVYAPGIYLEQVVILKEEKEFSKKKNTEKRNKNGFLPLV